MEDLKDARVLVTGSDRLHRLAPRRGTGSRGRERRRSCSTTPSTPGAGSNRSADVMKSRGCVRRRHPRSARRDRGRCRMQRRHAPGGADRDSVFLPLRPTPTSTPTSRGTLNVLQAARDAGRAPRRAHVDQRGLRQRAVRADHRSASAAGPVAVLGHRKIGADQMALSFHASFDMPVVVVRPFNTYGPRQSARAVIPTIISADRGGQAQIRSARSARRATSTTCAIPCAASSRCLTAPANDRRTDDQPRQRLRDLDRRHRAHDRRGDGHDARDRTATRRGCGPRTARWSGCGPTTPRRAQLLGWSPEYGGRRRPAPRPRRRRRNGSRPGQPRALQD